MSTKIYVGNLSPRTTQKEIRSLFMQYGEVDLVEVITDRYSGASRGFSFVVMNNNEAKQAMLALDKKKVDANILKSAKRDLAKYQDVNSIVAGEINELKLITSGVI
ncbi:MAG: RNA recognition motif domain-containing protein [Burkholderiales bacterium]